jgi:hypothetical protein
MRSLLWAEPRMLSQPAPHPQVLNLIIIPGEQTGVTLWQSTHAEYLALHRIRAVRITGDGRETRNGVFASQIWSETNRSAIYGARACQSLSQSVWVFLKVSKLHSCCDDTCIIESCLWTSSLKVLQMTAFTSLSCMGMAPNPSCVYSDRLQHHLLWGLLSRWQYCPKISI